jgi:hypothetical protein
MSTKDRIELMRDLAESSFLHGTPIASLAELIADELEQQRLRVDGMEGLPRYRNVMGADGKMSMIPEEPTGSGPFGF